MFTDASSHGYGGFTLQRLNELICSGSFADSVIQTSSTYRELLAVKYVLKSFGDLLKNQSVQINIDNFSSSRILSVGSTKTHLQDVAIDIFMFCLSKNIKLIPQWIPREQNQVADYYSKIKDSDDWSIDNNTFNNINRRFGPFTVDRFASNLNAKCKIFNSKYFCPGTSHVDTFTSNWKDENNWICPPISCIGSVIRHMELCKAYGTLFVPIWPSSYFWPVL